jgi:hypothetical protein
MKISIEVEISPDEVGLATELIATLRALTSHVSVKQVLTEPLFFRTSQHFTPACITSIQNAKYHCVKG